MDTNAKGGMEEPKAAPGGQCVHTSTHCEKGHLLRWCMCVHTELWGDLLLASSESTWLGRSSPMGQQGPMGSGFLCGGSEKG